MYWNDLPLYDRLMDRLKQGKTIAALVNPVKDTIIEMFRPDMDTECDASHSGGFLQAGIYDGTGPYSLDTASRGMMGNMISQEAAWIQYMFEDADLREVDELDTFCAEVRAHLSPCYQRSNFYDVQLATTVNALSIGDPILFGDEGDGGAVVWTMIHHKQGFPFYDRAGKLDGVIVEDKSWTAKQIMDHFIPDDGRDRSAERKKRFSISLNRALEDGQHNQEFTIYRAVFRAEDPIWKGHRQKLLGRNVKWISCWFEGDTLKKDDPLRMSPYTSQPMVTWSYDRYPWSKMSITPAFRAIYDALSHNQVAKAYLENLRLKNRPPRIVRDTMRGEEDFSDEGIMYVDDKEYDRPPKAIDLIGDIQMDVQAMERFEKSSERWFNLAAFQLLTQMAMQNRGSLPILQVSEMMGEKATLLAPAIQSHTKYLKDIDNRMMAIEMEAGRGPFNDDNMERIREIIQANLKNQQSSTKIMPKFIGTLANLQRQRETIKPMHDSLVALSPLIAVKPQVVNILREYEMADVIFDATGMPANCINTKEQYDEINAAQAQAQQQQQQFENMVEAAKASKSVSGPVDQNSLIGAVAGGQA